jgi:hypothetical protein
MTGITTLLPQDGGRRDLDGTSSKDMNERNAIQARPVVCIGHFILALMLFLN